MLAGEVGLLFMIDRQRPRIIAWSHGVGLIFPVSTPEFSFHFSTLTTIEVLVVPAILRSCMLFLEGWTQIFKAWNACPWAACLTLKFSAFFFPVCIMRKPVSVKAANLHGHWGFPMPQDITWESYRACLQNWSGGTRMMISLLSLPHFFGWLSDNAQISKCSSWRWGLSIRIWWFARSSPSLNRHWE